MRQLAAIVALLITASAASAQTVRLEVKSPEVVDDDFGSAIANVGDVDGDGFADLGVGAPASNLGGSESGAAYVYSGRTGELLHSFLGGSGDQLGSSLCGAGDVDGDGFADVLVGAPQATAQHWNKAGGYTRIYSGRSGEAIRSQAPKTPTQGFGTVVANVGDLDGDGMDDLAANAPIPLFDYVKVYSGRTGKILQAQFSPFAGTVFGSALLGVGDFDGDGRDDYAVGDPFDSWTGWEHSYSWIHSGATGEVLLQLSGSFPNDGFAVALATPGDLEGDGKPDLWVGSWGGYVRRYSGPASDRIVQEIRSPLQGFGGSVACADLDRDGSLDLLVGAPYSGGLAGEQVGSVLAFSGPKGQRLFQFDGSAPLDRIGTSLAAMGDLDGDGFEEFAVGAGSRRVLVLSPVDLPLSSAHPHPLVSTATGGAVKFELDAGPAFEFLPYVLLGSASGTAPGVPLGSGVVLPLVPDAYTEAILHSLGSPTFAGFSGVLNGRGRARARLDLSGGVDPALVGITLHHAFAAFDPAGSARFASNAVLSVLVPDPREVPSCSFPVPPIGNAGIEIVFDVSDAVDPNGSSIVHTWDFGDGSFATGAVVGHAFPSPGTYAVEHRVEDEDGNASACTRFVLVGAFNEPPTCAFAVESVFGDWRFDASGSLDGDGFIELYEWDFGDGTSLQTDGPETFHPFAAPGTYTVILTVTDDDGAISTCSRVVVIPRNGSPFCSFEVTPFLGSSLFDASGSVDDDGFIELYEWDFGDGTTATDGPVTLHQYSAAGTYAVTLTVTDDDGSSSTCAGNVVVP